MEHKKLRRGNIFLNSNMRYTAILLSAFILFLLQNSPVFAQTEGFLPFNSGKIYYKVQGEGTPILFVHAGFQDHNMWNPQVAHFSKKHKVIVFDVPGHGATVSDTARPQAAAVIKAVMDGLHIEKAVVVGLSLGGAMAIDFAVQHPQRVQKLVLAGSGLSGWDENRKVDTTTTQYVTALFDALGKKDTALAATIFVKNWFAGPTRTKEQLAPNLWDSGYAVTYQNMRKHKISGWPRFAQPAAIHSLKTLPMPVLILTGTIDMPEVLLMNAWLKEHIPNARQVLMPGQAHMLNLEDPVQFNKLIEDFIKQPS